MPAGCVQCAPGQWECGSDVTELCGGAGVWTPAGALCLQLFVRKHPKTGNCLVRVELTPQADCGGGAARPKVPIDVVRTVVTPPVAMKKKPSTRRKS
jgi:hypothetical protein